MATLQTVWELAQTAGEPHSVIRVRNLQTSLKVGKDAWGGEGKLQPVLISATVSLRKPFESASTEDAVTKSTVHYGILSKAILDACTKFSEGNSAVLTLRAFLTSLLVHLTESSPPTIPVIPKAILSSLEVKITLPKASLIGTGVSLTSALTYNAKNDGISAGSSVLALHELRIPTLIGVNPNERLAKQIVVANIQLDPWVSEKDVYNELEEIVVKTIEESSFKTLEALASHVGQRVIQYFFIPLYKNGVFLNYPRIHICLEKPTAVMFADAPAIEVLIESDPAKNQTISGLREWAKLAEKPPFPLNGRLDEWILRL